MTKHQKVLKIMSLWETTLHVCCGPWLLFDCLILLQGTEQWENSLEPEKIWKPVCMLTYRSLLTWAPLSHWWVNSVVLDPCEVPAFYDSMLALSVIETKISEKGHIRNETLFTNQAIWWQLLHCFNDSCGGYKYLKNNQYCRKNVLSLFSKTNCFFFLCLVSHMIRNMDSNKDSVVIRWHDVLRVTRNTNDNTCTLGDFTWVLIVI